MCCPSWCTPRRSASNESFSSWRDALGSALSGTRASLASFLGTAVHSVRLPSRLHSGSRTQHNASVAALAALEAAAPPSATTTAATAGHSRALALSHLLASSGPAPTAAAAQPRSGNHGDASHRPPHSRVIGGQEGQEGHLGVITEQRSWQPPQQQANSELNGEEGAHAVPPCPHPDSPRAQAPSRQQVLGDQGGAPAPRGMMEPSPSAPPALLWRGLSLEDDEDEAEEEGGGAAEGGGVGAWASAAEGCVADGSRHARRGSR